jgi:hypothetical protein
MDKSCSGGAAGLGAGEFIFISGRKKAQKAQNENLQIFCAFCDFLRLKSFSSGIGNL